MTEASSSFAKFAANPVIWWVGLPMSAMPNMEASADLGEMTDKGTAHARATFASVRIASEQAADLFQNTYTTVAEGATDYSLKAMEIARVNGRTAFEYIHELLGARSLPEFVELSSTHLRRQVELVSAQNKELCALAQNVATKTAEPIGRIILGSAYGGAAGE
jgi:phasin